MSKSKKKLFSVLFVFVVLAMASLACDEAGEIAAGFNGAEPTPMNEWTPPSQENLTIEQQNELLKVVEFSVDGSLPEGKEAALFLGDTLIWRLRADGSTHLPLEADERFVTLKIRNEGSADDWAALKSLGRVDQGAVIRISFDGGSAQIGIGNTGG